MTAGEMGVEALAKRLRGELANGEVVTDPGAVRQLNHLWNVDLVERPAVVARCASTSDVQVAVRAARDTGVALAVRGGGHDPQGRSVLPAGLQLDLRPMRAVKVTGDTARVGGGASVSDLLNASCSRGYSAVVGTVGSVGAAGLTMGGGYGVLNGVVGMALDNLLSAEVVLADGRVVTANDGREPDLYWALRGGGGNFGVVTSFRTQLYPIPEVTAGPIEFAWNQARSVLLGLRELTANAPHELDVMFDVVIAPSGPALSLTPTWSGDPTEAHEQIDRVRSLGRPVRDEVVRGSLAKSARAMSDQFGPGHWRLSARNLAPFRTDSVDAFIASAEAMPSGSVLFVHHAHGAVTKVPIGDTAFACRREHLVVQIIGGWDADDGGAAAVAWMEETERRLDPHALSEGWPSLMAPDDPRAASAFGPNTDRLRTVKAAYDPDAVFRSVPLPS